MFKGPKTAAGARTTTIPASTVQVLGEHRRKQLERRMPLGLGRPLADARRFRGLEGEPLSLNKLSWRWRNIVETLGLPRGLSRAAAHACVRADRGQGRYRAHQQAALHGNP